MTTTAFWLLLITVQTQPPMHFGVSALVWPGHYSTLAECNKGTKNPDGTPGKISKADAVKQLQAKQPKRLVKGYCQKHTV